MEVWKKSADSVGFLTKMSCPGTTTFLMELFCTHIIISFFECVSGSVSQIAFGAEIPQIRTYGVMFVSHQGKQYVQYSCLLLQIPDLYHLL